MPSTRTHAPRGALVFDMRQLGRQAVSEGVLVTGTAIAPLAGECARCLAPLTSSVTVGFQELYLYAESRHDKHDKHDKHDDQEEQDARELYHLDGDLLDLEPAFRDAVVLALPMSPLCREDCPGLCAECGARLADTGPDHRHDAAVDPRWAALQQLSEQGNDKHQDRRAGAIDLQEG